MLVLEPTGEAAAPSPEGVRLLGITATQTPRWRTMRHVFELGDDSGLNVDVGPWGDVLAYAVGYAWSGDELLTPL